MHGPIKDTTFVAFDIETTGLAPVCDRIVEIGAVKFRDEKVIDTFEELVDPQTPISAEATQVNGITDDMVRGRPTIEQVLPQFVSFLGEAVPVAHNAPFDVGFLCYDISRLHLKAAERPILDTCAIPKKVLPQLSSYSLENLARDLQIRSDLFHRALADARVCMQILGACVARMGGADKVKLGDLLDANGPALYLNVGEIVFERRFQPLKEALESQAVVEIVYQNGYGSTTTRRIKPLTVGLYRGTVMVEAFCHLRRGKRSFRLDRIVEVRQGTAGGS
jgi:DNA polymerase III epsilon subunit family exonuclease